LRIGRGGGLPSGGGSPSKQKKKKEREKAEQNHPKGRKKDLSERGPG